MPFLVPTFKPAAFAKETSGRTPIAKIIKSAGSSTPFAKTTDLSVMLFALVPRCSFTPCERISLATKVAISGSNGANTWFAASTTQVSIPRWIKFSAISTPIKPPPITTAFLGFRFTCETIRSTSSTVRSVNALSTPGIGGTIGEAPGLKINLS